MSVDISDTNVHLAYNEIVSGAHTNWLLLGYGQTNHKLTLLETGSRGVDEMRPFLADEVLFGFVRVQGQFCLVAYMPEGVSGVKRARALVHSRAVGNLFKAHQAVLNASKPEDVNDVSICDKLGIEPADDHDEPGPSPTRALPTAHMKSATYTDGVPTPPPSVPRLSADSSSPRTSSVSAFAASPANAGPYQPRVSSGSAAPSLQQYPLRPMNPPSSQIPTSGPEGVQTSLAQSPALQRITDSPRSSVDTDPSYQSRPTMNAREDSPPPVPPKSDWDGSGLRQPIMPRMRVASNSEAVFRQGTINQTEESVSPVSLSQRIEYNQQRSVTGGAMPIREQRSLRDFNEPPRTEAQMQAAISRAKWDAEARAAVTEDQTALQERRAEAERAQLERHIRDRATMDREERMAAAAEEARRLDAAQRLRLEEMRRADDNRKRMVEAERRDTSERLKREAAQERLRQQEEAEQQLRQQEEAKRLQKEQWKKDRAAMEEKFKSLQGTGKVMLTGWVSHQIGVIWRRRFFHLRGDCLLLHKNAEELTRPLSVLSVGAIRGVVDARDELQLPNSLRIDFADQESAFFYCDSPEDKEVFVCGLRQAANV